MPCGSDRSPAANTRRGRTRRSSSVTSLMSSSLSSFFATVPACPRNRCFPRGNDSGIPYCHAISHALKFSHSLPHHLQRIHALCIYWIAALQLQHARESMGLQHTRLVEGHGQEVAALLQDAACAGRAGGPPCSG